MKATKPNAKKAGAQKAGAQKAGSQEAPGASWSMTPGVHPVPLCTIQDSPKCISSETAGL